MLNTFVFKHTFLTQWFFNPTFLTSWFCNTNLGLGVGVYKYNKNVQNPVLKKTEVLKNLS